MTAEMKQLGFRSRTAGYLGRHHIHPEILFYMAALSV
jgi:hypothetical protein